VFKDCEIEIVAVGLRTVAHLLAYFVQILRIEVHALDFD